MKIDPDPPQLLNPSVPATEVVGIRKNTESVRKMRETNTGIGMTIESTGRRISTVLAAGITRTARGVEIVNIGIDIAAVAQKMLTNGLRKPINLSLPHQ